MNPLKHLYLEELRDLYNAERQLVRALPTLAQASTSGALRASFEADVDRTKEHVSRLKTILKAMGESPKGRKCRGMKGLIRESTEIIGTGRPPGEVDARLVSGARRVEHYEIAAYGCLSAYARLLEDEQAVALLKHTLEEENETNEELTQLSGRIYAEAAHADDPASGPWPGEDSSPDVPVTRP